MAWNFLKELDRHGPGRHACPVPCEFARNYCDRVARYHVEPGSLLSFWQPRRQLGRFAPFFAFYRWCRAIADEMGGTAAIFGFRWWLDELNRAIEGRPRHPVMVALQEARNKFAIPAHCLNSLADLIFACEQDVLVRQFRAISALNEHFTRTAAVFATVSLAQFRLPHDGIFPRVLPICEGLVRVEQLRNIRKNQALNRNPFTIEELERFGIDSRIGIAQYPRACLARLMQYRANEALDWLLRGRPVLEFMASEVRAHFHKVAATAELLLSRMTRNKFQWKSVLPAMGFLDHSVLLVRNMWDRFGTALAGLTSHTAPTSAAEPEPTAAQVPHRRAA